ncbi:MAG TPA: tetratricopeptide repeat protein [Azospirillum sp.]
MKINRNAPCPCGSGKKYKKCCLRSKEDAQRELDESQNLIFQDKAEYRVEGLGRLEKLRKNGKLSDDQRINAALAHAHALQGVGNYAESLRILQEMQPDLNSQLAAHIEIKRAVCLVYLERGREAVELLGHALRNIADDAMPIWRAGMYLEASRVFGIIGLDDETYEWAMKSAGIFYELGEHESYARALSNAASTLLHREDEGEQLRGVGILEEASIIKESVGDFEGLSTNECLLGSYFYRKGNLGRALAHYRRDLAIARKVGNQLGVAISHGNLAGLYADLRQLKSARDQLYEMKKISNNLENPWQLRKAELLEEKINSIGRELGQSGIAIGPSAQCVCNSGKIYKECCGFADFEPLMLHVPFGGVSEDASDARSEFSELGLKLTFLDHVLRDTPSAKKRLSWSRISRRDGVYIKYELPDMANHHLTAAKQLLLVCDDSGVHGPMSAILMAVCSAEAFINSLCYFIVNEKDAEELGFVGIPEKLADNCLEYQRTTELRSKWIVVGSVVTWGEWKPSGQVWDDFNRLVSIRNELVHFKADYELVEPRKTEHPLIKGLPDSIKVRNIPFSWPFRLLTKEAAEWGVGTVEKLFDDFRSCYRRARIARAKSDSP